MEKKLMHLLVVFALTFSGMAKAQRTQPQEIVVQSWQTGTETISDQTVRISLGLQQGEYSTDVVGNSGKRFKLAIIHNPLSNVKTEHWKIELREVLSAREGKDVLGKNLLIASRPEPGADYFPREDLVGYLYPNEDPPVVWVAGNPYFEGHPFYPIKATRKIRVEGFYLIAKIENYQFSNTDKTKLDFLDLTIEFQNACK